MAQLHPGVDIKMNRRGFGLKNQVEDKLHGHYHSDLIEQIRESGYQKTFGDITFHLAKEFGYCYGVERAVQLAYQTRQQYPNRRITLTTEIIHNPQVNQNLLEMEIGFLNGPYQNRSYNELTKKDVVIVPAFGTTIDELKKLAEIDCEMVDTICGSVITVWKRVEKYAREGFTSLIHGKNYHEETEATKSRVTAFKDAHYLVVLNKEQAQFVIDYLLGSQTSKKEFLEFFGDAVSSDFDPDIHLNQIGCANQTTMLSSESLEIARMFEKALAQKFGNKNIATHFRSFDTICSATQERQDAMIELIQKKPDLFIVIGGYNSSNTNHLCKIASQEAPAYHIDRAECILSADKILHKPAGQKKEVATQNWLKEGKLDIGVTAGASTPNQVVGEALKRVLRFRNQLADEFLV